LVAEREGGGGLPAQKVAVNSGLEVKRIVVSGSVQELLCGEGAELRQRCRLVIRT
jgi:hypothetical protein